MPRVLRILNRLAVGGPVLNATYLTKYLPPEYETLFVVGELEGHEKSAEYLTKKLGIEYTVIPGMGRSINPISDRGAYNELKTLMQKFKPDVVHTHAAKPGALGRLAASALNVPAIVHTFHGHVFHSYFNALKTRIFIETERFLARRSHAIIAISDQQKKELVEDFRIAPENKFRVVPLGFDLDRFQEDQPAKRKKFRDEFKLADDEIAIGIIGRLVPVKNHYLFLKAVRHLMDNSSKKFKAFIIGDGETREDLEKMASESGIPFSTQTSRDHPHPLIFTSWRSDVDVINAGLDISCLTSFNEGTPVSLIEAQASNKPIVSTRVGGISDIVMEGKTGLLSNVEDADGFCANLLNLVENDAYRMELGRDASNHILQRYSYHRLVADVDRLYRDILDGKRN